ncbi:MAG: M23 family metallopeptidase, partial [Bradyrhizobiaceae bacterium]|nr:M23 family metallopeptidase [Bradyrhizobiaceae bacterium]
PAAPSPSAATAATPTHSGQTLLPVPPVHTVAAGDTLGRVAHHYHVSAREIAVANGLSPDAPLRVGTRLTIPVSMPTLAQARPPADARTPQRVAAADPPAATAHLATPVEHPAAAANGAPAFRWPARGRIVNNYGARVNGATNDGIDLAVPEGTPVRSADDGVVAYAGNELKGYGNLVLVRHANGYVTAYANGSELLVKRNDQVHKGQVVMKSGQTGNAAAPQLHFEIRKNSAPVDPTQYLPADKSASAPL